MPGFDLDNFLPYQLSVAARRVSEEFEKLYALQFGLSLAEWRVIAHLSQVSKISVKDVHRKVDMDKSKVSRAADRLVARGLVAKNKARNDGRLIELALTQSGQEMIGRLIPLATSFDQELRQKLGIQDIATIKRLAFRDEKP